MSNKWVQAAIYGILAFLLSAPLAAAISGHSLTANVVFTAVVAAIGTMVGKVMDGNAIIDLPPWAEAVAMALMSVAPMVNDLFNSGSYTALSAWVPILLAFVTALYAKWTVPTKMFTLTARRAALSP